ncbi:hypothetical protein ACIF8T_21620 [Streptomyces sp. NPDC085946]|uniref:hypothetical protein n=1 Tax=Streptomyces sp. NPDC085946 TaxID=3365744 RepID=UPI0037D90F0B
MAKTWQPRDEKRFARELRFNTPYYVIRDLATNLAPFEDAQRYEVHVFTERAPITGTPMTANGVTARDLCRNRGPVYDTMPENMRRSGAPGAQVGAPLGSNDYQGYLDKAEIRALEKLALEANDRRNRRR